MVQELDLTLTEIAKRLDSGGLTAEALAEAAIANHERFGNALQAYKLWQPEVVRAAARAADLVRKSSGTLGPLHGIPVSVKDLFAVNGWPTFVGSPKRLPPEFEVEGPVVGAVRRQLAVLTGKTHTVEFAYGGLGTNQHWGTPRNPWDASRHRVPGGSSSGAGVSLAEGSALVALGSDTGGSIRIPASMTGNVGLKLTYGRWSRDGIVPLASSLDTPGPLARTVEDAAFAFAAIDPGTEPAAFMRSLERADAGGVRLGLVEDFFWDDCSPGVAEGVKAALDEAARAGAKLVPFRLPEVREAYAIVAKGGIMAAEFYAFVSTRLPDWLKTLNRILLDRFERVDKPRELSAADYLDRLATLARLATSAAARLSEVDAVVVPTVPVTPPVDSDVVAFEGYREPNRLASRNTYPGNLLRLCALTMPVALDRAGMPVGLQLLAGPMREERLLAVGAALERALGSARMRLGTPPLCR